MARAMVGSTGSIDDRVHTHRPARVAVRQRVKVWAREPFRLASWLGMLVLVVASLRAAYEVGIVWDEEADALYGDHVLAWFTSGFTNEDALTNGDLHLYGTLFELPAQWLVANAKFPWGQYETRHMLTALIAALGVLAVGKAAARIAGRRAGFLAGLTLALTPCWTGHGFFNAKDIPFAVAAAFVVYSCVRIALQSAPLRWSDAWVAGASAGCAIGIRAGGMFVLAYPALTSLARFALDARELHASGGRRAVAKASLHVLSRLAAALVVAWALMVCTWPWGMISPIAHPLEAARAAKRFVWNGSTLFEGTHVPADNVPPHYLFRWFSITLPEIYLFAAICVAVAAVSLIVARKRPRLDLPHALAIATLAGAVVIPLGAVLIVHPVIYDAHRHFLFLVPPLAAGAGVALDWAWSELSLPYLVRVAGAWSFAVLCGMVIFDMGRLHPFEYLYFNRMAGGLPAAAGRYETDYWGASYREGIEWVAEHVRRRSGKLRVAVCDAAPRTKYYVKRSPEMSEHLVIVDRLQDADVTLAYTRGDCAERYSGLALHQVEREGVALLHVFARKPQKITVSLWPL
jgi:hypothetical protein